MGSLDHRLPAQVSVLVSGFGPVGAALGCLLGRYGVDTLVVDQAQAILQHPRAIALDNEALRVLQMAGVEEKDFSTVAIPQVKMHCPYLGEFARVNTAGSMDGHPKLVTFFQPELEAALRKRAEALPSVRTATGVTLEGFEEMDDGIRATLVDKEGCERQVRCDYLVGADGASSMVREAIGEAFRGRTYAQDWLIVDARHEDASRAIDHVEFLCDHRRPTPHMVAPGNRQRWEFMLNSDDDREAILEQSNIEKLLEPWTKHGPLEIERKAVYRFHSRCVRRFSRGRVFLAGDAAHITPPFVGQGLVAGLRDAANLAWKLAWVVKGRAGVRILDSYSRERRPHALAMIRLAQLMGSLVMPNNRLIAIASHGFMRGIRLVGPLRRLVEELEVKPANAFRRGLFLRGRGKGRLRAGATLPQGWVRDRSGQMKLSDELLGPHMTLVGFGVDPQTLLSEDSLTSFHRAGGVCIHLARRGEALADHDASVEDVTDVLVEGIAPPGWLVLVRPDRVIMHQGSPDAAEAILKEALPLLAVPSLPNENEKVA